MFLWEMCGPERGRRAGLCAAHLYTCVPLSRLLLLGAVRPVTEPEASFLPCRFLGQAHWVPPPVLGVKVTHSQPGESDAFSIITVKDRNSRWDETCVTRKVQSTVAGSTEEQALRLGHQG